jgi:REP element-mobilizing transposase RayT
MTSAPKYDPAIHHRRSIRLHHYDYSSAGAYFLTICAQNRKCLFGNIRNGAMELNEAGKMVQAVWEQIPIHYRGIKNDAFVVMPNHVHGIIVIATPLPIGPVGADPCVCPLQPPPACPGVPNTGTEEGRTRGSAPTQASQRIRALSVPEVVQRFKTLTTKRYGDGVRNALWQPFPNRLWQRNYYEHIVRGEEDLLRVREYIAFNPAQWPSDELNPMNP